MSTKLQQGCVWAACDFDGCAIGADEHGAYAATYEHVSLRLVAARGADAGELLKGLVDREWQQIKGIRRRAVSSCSTSGSGGGGGSSADRQRLQQQATSTAAEQPSVGGRNSKGPGAPPTSTGGGRVPRPILKRRPSLERVASEGQAGSPAAPRQLHMGPPPPRVPHTAPARAEGCGGLVQDGEGPSVQRSPALAMGRAA